MGFGDSTCYLLNKGFEFLEQVRPVYEGKIVPRGTADSSVAWEFSRADIEWTFYSDLIDLKGRKMLDVGCGYEGKTAFYATKGANVTGVDMRPGKLATARLFAREKGVESETLFLCADAASLPFASNTFEVVMSNNVIPYLTNPLESLREWGRGVKPQGLICVNFGPPWLAPNGAPDIGRCFPWTHLLFSETAIRKAFARMKRSLPDHNGSIYGNMNRINIRRFKQLLMQQDLNLVYFKLWTRRYAAPLILMPFMREFFSAQVISILSKRPMAR